MTPKDKLLRTIQMYCFALQEIQLYLDTHPDCPQGMEYYRKYKKLKSEAAAEYNRMYGPLTADMVESKDKWTWTAEPFPWERSAD